MTCPTCEGKRYVPGIPSLVMPGCTVAAYDRCPRCKGTAEVPDQMELEL